MSCGNVSLIANGHTLKPERNSLTFLLKKGQHITPINLKELFFL